MREPSGGVWSRNFFVKAAKAGQARGLAVFLSDVDRFELLAARARAQNLRPTSNKAGRAEETHTEGRPPPPPPNAMQPFVVISYRYQPVRAKQAQSSEHSDPKIPGFVTRQFIQL